MRAFAKLATLVMVLGAATVIHAQDEGGGTSTPPAQGTAKPQSVADMRAAAERVRFQIHNDDAFIRHLKHISEKQKDRIKVNCVNFRLVQIKPQRNIADGLAEQLKAALAQNDDNRYALFADYEEAGAKIAKLREEATACVGEPELFKQESGVDVSAPYIPDDPVTDNPFDGTADYVDVEPPGYASPFF